MALGDNILELFIRANIEQLKPQMDAAVASVKGAIDTMKASAVSLPDTISTAMAQATAAFVTANPQIQQQAMVVTDLQLSYDRAKTSLQETQSVIRESGGTANAAADILKVLAQETVEVTVKQLALRQATTQLDSEIKKLVTSQTEATETAKAQGAAAAEAAEKTGLAAAEFNAVGKAALAFADGVVEASNGAAAAAARVLDLKATLNAATVALRECEKAILDLGGAENASAEQLSEYQRLVVLQRASQLELTAATKEYQEILNQGFAAQVKATEALNADTTAKETNNRVTQQSTTLGKEFVVTDEMRANVKAKLAEMEARDTAATSLNASTKVSASRAVSSAQSEAAATASTASEAYVRLAKATLDNAVAQAEVRTLMRSATEYTGLQSTFVNELAIAQERAALTSAELATAEKALTAVTVESSEAQNTFRARIIASEYGVRGFISGMVTSVPVLVGIMAASFGIRMVDSIKQTELELSNLSRLTGESVAYLYDMGRAAEASGAKSDDLTGAFRRLDKVISDAASGSESARLTLKELGVDMTVINAGIVPRTSTVLAQMADYLHQNAGNAEVMRAAMRALGTDSVALAAFLSQGSQEVRRQSETFVETGNAMSLSTAEAHKLSQTQAELGATFDRVKIGLLPLLNDFVDLEKWLARVTGVANLFSLAMKGIDETVKLLHGDFSSLQSALPDFLKTVPGGELLGESTIDLSKVGAFKPPAPPQFALTKEEKPKAPREEKSDLPLFREELAQQEALFEGSRAEMLAMELAFWERLISAGRVKARDLIAVQAEIARSEIQLKREVIREAEASSREDVALTRAGSEQRVSETARNMELERRLHKEGSVEFAEAQKEYLLAVRSRVEETIRLQVQATEEAVALEKRGSEERVVLYQSQLTALQKSLDQATASTTSAEKEWTTTGNEQAHQRMLIFAGETEFIRNEISRVTKEFNAASRERTAQLEKERADAARLRVTQAIGTAETSIRSADVTAAENIRNIEQNNILFLGEKVRRVQEVINIQRAQVDNALSGAEAEAAANVATAKTTEEKIAAEKQLLQVLELRAREQARLQREQMDLDNKVARQMETNALRVGSVISTSFTSAFDRMLTAHTKFSEVMAQFWNNMVLGFARMGLEILANWLKMIAAKVVAWILGEQMQTAATAAGATARGGIGFTEMIKSIGRAAAKAAAWAFSGVMEAFGGLPIAVPLAAAAAAGTFAVVLALGALASAKEGALLTKDTLVAAHSGELVVPAEKTQELLGAFPNSRLPASISSGLTSLASAAKIGTGVLQAGSGAASTAFNSSMHSAEVSNKVDARTVHVRPQVTVNQHGDSSGRMSLDEIMNAVNLGIRRGMAKA